MGIGDEIMASGEARKLVAGTNRRVAIIDARPGRQRHRWHEMWAGNPAIAAPGERFDVEHRNHGGHRPYIESKGVHAWQWRPYSPTPGEIFLSPAEHALATIAAGKVVIQPCLRDGVVGNKQWGLDRWTQLVALAPDLPWLQIGAPGAPRIPGTAWHETRSFRDACGVLSGARAAVLLEGGLHHAAAALGVRAVVIFGGFISPAVTGYDSHRNLFMGGERYPLGCGMRIPCRHCADAMAGITPRQVLTELEVILV